MSSKGTRKYTVASATVHGAEAVLVSVEVSVGMGIPGISIVGMPDAAVQEARERVKAALRSCGFSLPNEKVVFNLAPASMRKVGSGFDLPLALALLVATGQIPQSIVEGRLVAGELSLDGKVREVNGLVAFQMCASHHGLDMLCSSGYLPLDLRNGMSVFHIQSLSSLGEGPLKAPVIQRAGDRGAAMDYADIGGHATAKRALQIAAAGNLGLLMIGPPGSGKTALAQRLPTILPPLTGAEIGQSAQIASIVGEPVEGIVDGIRPFRAPHHSATLAGLVGGGNPVRPGEVSLAHNGVLMLDELAEFSGSVLQGLRQPIEDGRVTITRADGSVTMPAKFMLVAASNPCPCGYYGDERRECTCPPARINAYQSKIGGPLADRFDMCIDVWRSSFDDVVAGDSDHDSSTLREGVLAARKFAFERFRKDEFLEGAKTSVGTALAACHMGEGCRGYFRNVAQANALSGRGILRVLRVARAIADIDQSYEVLQEHIAEACMLRLRNAEKGGT